jgi:transcriptional regulator with PAS, ATPase and Fis domain
MRMVLEVLERYASLDTAILLQGETGSGKEVVATALHALSRRNTKPLVVVDCGSLPEYLLESELFGHERGAFTGADRPYGGRIQAACGGTLFLDEVNSISLAMQAKLLRFLERKEICRVGRAQPIWVDVRVISASNVPLDQLVESGRMRADFYYRLNVLRIDLPPLRQRLEDIPLLVRRFMATDPVARDCGVTEVSTEVLAELQSRPWPGNVRELFNVLRRAIILGADGPVLTRLPADEGDPFFFVPRPTGGDGYVHSRFRAWLREQEREYFSDLLRRYRTVRQQAAASGLPQRTLYRKVRRLGIQAARKF